MKKPVMVLLAIYIKLCVTWVFTYSWIMTVFHEEKIFQRNFSKSLNCRWSLTELVKIFECEKNGQLVLPVIFRVNPLEIEEKLERDFAKHEAELDDVEMVQRWRAALTKAVNFLGSLYNDGYIFI